MPTEGFEPEILTLDRPHTYSLGRTFRPLLLGIGKSPDQVDDGVAQIPDIHVR